MKTQSPDWREALRDWLKTNQKTIPGELRALRDEFVRCFPKERLGQLTLQQYALGHEAYKDSFCYWLEVKTVSLGSVRGGNVTKFWVWFDGKTKEWKWVKWLEVENAEQALAKVLTRLQEAIRYAEQDKFDKLDETDLPASLGLKALSLYFPDKFLPIFSQEHLAHFLAVFGLKPEGGVVIQNRQLFEYLRGQAEFAGFDETQIMRFLYDALRPPQSEEMTSEGSETELPLFRVNAGRSLNWIYYGPPGTGKTWSALHEVRLLLLTSNIGPKDAARYAELLDKEDDASKTERQRLASLLEGAGEQKESRYWWVTANPAEWTWDELFREKAEVFRRGRIQRNYEEIAEGDLVFGYTSWPKKELTAMAG